MRMIERWFPCAEVSEASASGWGSGASEKSLFTWFAARPTAQAKAAVLTSLLPWPEDEVEQRRLQALVRTAMTGRDAGWDELAAELQNLQADVAVADIFSGRAMIPFEAARLGLPSRGFDYSPVATLAGQLLADFCVRDWSEEPMLSFGEPALSSAASRLPEDASAMLALIEQRHDARMADYYPAIDGERPWGYIWVTTLPCQECGYRTPLTGSLVLRQPNPQKGDLGQSYDFVPDRTTGTFTTDVHQGAPVGQPTLAATSKAGKAARGKSAVCIFCCHVHAKAVHTRLMSEGHAQDALVAVAHIKRGNRRFRSPTQVEITAAATAAEALTAEPPFAPELPAVPHERIPAGNNHTVRPSLYGAQTYGDLCNERQTLSFVTFCRVINEVAGELIQKDGVSSDYALGGR